MAKREYKRIGGRGARKGQIFTRNTLWVGADHLLQVENTGYTEEYKRFYFRDIQSITITRDKRALVWSIFFGVMIAIGGALLWTAEDNGARLFSICFISLFAVPLLINLIKGPSCFSVIKTAVQEEQVPAFRRIKSTEKALARIRESIAAAQGSMSAEEIRGRIAGVSTNVSTAGGSEAVPPRLFSPASPEASQT
jgi:hypothetical protein